MSNKRTINEYTSHLYDLIRGSYTYGMDEEQLSKQFMNQARLRWFQNAIKSFSEFKEDHLIKMELTNTGKSAVINIDIPELTPSGNRQYLQIKTTLKVKD